MRILLSILLIFILTGKVLAHPSHMSVINMEIQEKEMQIDFSIRLFQEDYNYLVTGIYHDELAASKIDSTIDLNRIIVNQYIEKCLTFSIDGEITEPTFKKLKYEETDVWLYFSIKLDKIPESIGVQNKIFLDLYSDQINLLILAYRSNEVGFTFDNQNSEQLISLKSIY